MTHTEDNTIRKYVRKYQGNLQHAFEKAAEDIGTTSNVVEKRWYSSLRYTTPIFTTASEDRRMINRKNVPRIKDENGNVDWASFRDRLGPKNSAEMKLRIQNILRG